MAASAGSRRGVPTSDGSVLVQPGPKSRGNRNGHRAATGDRPDASVLRPSIAVSLTGMKQALRALDNGTPEVKHFLLNECQVILECRTCFNMFRSIANFIAHKRSYCQAKIKDVRHVYRRDPPAEFDASAEEEDTTTAFVEPEPVETCIPEPEWDLQDYSPSLELLKEAGLIQEIASKPLVTSLKPNSLAGIVDRLRWKKAGGNESDYFRSREDNIHFRLERIRQTSQAMFQTPGFESLSMGERYVELERLKHRASVFLGPDGKIIDPGPAPPRLAFFGGDEEFTVYPCPKCPNKVFKLLKGVFRHGIRFHNMDLPEAKALKKQSKKMAVTQQSNSVKSISSYNRGGDSFFYCESCYKTFVNVQGRNSHERYCDEVMPRSYTPSASRVAELKRNQPTVRVHRLANHAVKRALVGFKVKSRDERDDKKKTASVVDDEIEHMSGASSGVASNEENDCNVENVAKKRKVVTMAPPPRPVVELNRIRNRSNGEEAVPSSSFSFSSSLSEAVVGAKSSKGSDDDEVSDEITLAQVNLVPLANKIAPPAVTGARNRQKQHKAEEEVIDVEEVDEEGEVSFKAAASASRRSGRTDAATVSTPSAAPVATASSSSSSVQSNGDNSSPRPRNKRKREHTVKVTAETDDSAAAAVTKKPFKTLFDWVKRTERKQSPVGGGGGSENGRKVSNSSRSSSEAEKAEGLPSTSRRPASPRKLQEASETAAAARSRGRYKSKL